MFCMKCGTKLPDDAQFCSSCGERIIIPSAQKSIEDSVQKDSIVSKSIIEVLRPEPAQVFTIAGHTLECSSEIMTQAKLREKFDQKGWDYVVDGFDELDFKWTSLPERINAIDGFINGKVLKDAKEFVQSVMKEYGVFISEDDFKGQLRVPSVLEDLKNDMNIIIEASGHEKQGSCGSTIQTYMNLDVDRNLEKLENFIFMVRHVSTVSCLFYSVYEVYLNMYTFCLDFLNRKYGMRYIGDKETQDAFAEKMNRRKELSKSYRQGQISKDEIASGIIEILRIFPFTVPFYFSLPGYDEFKEEIENVTGEMGCACEAELSAYRFHATIMRQIHSRYLNVESYSNRDKVISGIREEIKKTIDNYSIAYDYGSYFMKEKLIPKLQDEIDFLND